MVSEPDLEKFLTELDNTVNQFLDYCGKNVILISHNDADGISCLHLLQNLLFKRHLEFDSFIYNRSVSWADYLKGILPKKDSKKARETTLFLTDIGSNLEELLPIIEETKHEHYFILDHHEVESYDKTRAYPENLHFLNPTLYGFDGLDHVAGATLAYLFARKVDPSIITQGWLSVIGIAGDSLRPMDKLESFNKEVYEELVNEKIVEDKEGLILFGAMHESIKNGLKYSILPFIRGLGGEEDAKIKKFLRNLNIDPNKKVVNLSDAEIEKIQQEIGLENRGHYCLLPKKSGLLSFAFEHALLLNILCFKNIHHALSITRQKSPSRQAKSLYQEYISNLSHNLKEVLNLPKTETEKAIFIEVGDTLPPSNWSDTTSFCSVNELLDPYKILFLGGEEKKNHMIKLSIRCSRKYLEKNNGVGVNQIITRIKKELGGIGGGHKLAGGIRLSIPSYKRLKEQIDDLT
ncbi:MAG: hypothetical protein ACTSXH_14755 [Promethearchaeota archaeon]